MLVGEAGGHLEFGFDRPPIEAWATTTAWGSLDDLREVVRLARSAPCTLDVERMPLRTHRSPMSGCAPATCPGGSCSSGSGVRRRQPPKRRPRMLRLLRPPHVERRRGRLVRLAQRGARRSVTARSRRQPRCSVATACSRLRTASKSPRHRVGPSWMPAVQPVARAQHPRSLDLWQLHQLALQLASRTAAGPRSGARAAAAAIRAGAREAPPARFGSIPAARNGSTADRDLDLRRRAGVDDDALVGRLGSLEEIARRQLDASLPGGPNSQDASGRV